ncbi:MAG: zinc ribbon domain-containing protein [Anaerolineales bacterium]|nr:MAG: zinc ribbon domain-containing protein [Anaerolineales bacterium]
MARRVTKGFVQLEWVCPNCDGRNPGPEKTCQSCGAPQPENVQFQRAAEEKIITDEKVAEAVRSGADIHCGFCGTRNPATAITCSQCGGNLEEGMARQKGRVLQAAPTPPKALTCTNCGTENPGTERNCSKCGAPLPRLEAPKPMQAQAGAAQQTVPKKKTNWFLFGGIAAFLVFCCVALAVLFLLPSKSLEGTVTNVQWQTFVPVQEIRAVDYSNERGSPPSDAYNVSCRNESREVCTERVEDTGTGFGEVVEDCHTETEQYCSYTRDEWKTIQTYDLSGNDLFPSYANPSIASDQRVGSTSENLSVYFSTSDGQETYSPKSLSEFQQFTIGSVWTLKLNALGGIVSVER